jgi:hypothetical protein
MKYSRARFRIVDAVICNDSLERLICDPKAAARLPPSYAQLKESAEPLTLAQLKEAEPDMFTRAGVTLGDQPG